MKIQSAVVCKICKELYPMNEPSCPACSTPVREAVPVKAFVEHFYSEEKK